MVQTIVTSTRISVQGEFVKKLSDGRVMVRVGEARYIGKPIQRVIEQVRNLRMVKPA